MDLELRPTEAYAYTVNEMEKNLALAEIHAKQYGEDPIFCSDCLRKHFIVIEGLAEEGINFTDVDTEKKFFSKTAELMRMFKSSIPELSKEMAFAMAEGVRKIRKALGAPVLAKEAALSNPNPAHEKDLNTPNEIDIRNRGNKMEKKELITVVGSQLLGSGIQEAIASVDKPVWQNITLSNVVGIGGGLAGCLLALFKKLPSGYEKPVVIVSSKLLADEVVKVAKQYIPVGGVAMPAISVAPSYFAPARGDELVKVE